MVPLGRNSLFEDNAEFGFGMDLACDPAPRRSWPIAVRKLIAVECMLATNLRRPVQELAGQHGRRRRLQGRRKKLLRYLQGQALWKAATAKPAPWAAR